MKKKRKVGRPKGMEIKTGATPKLWHPSKAKSEAAKSRKRDERGYYLGKRQLRFDINYIPEEQLYHLIATSGNGEIDEKEQASGMERIKILIERIFKNWRANLQ